MSGGLTMPDTQLPVAFPEIGNPTDVDVVGTIPIGTLNTIAKPATEEEIAKESTGWGYTHPNLHRRIQDKEFRAAAREPSSNYYTISSNVFAVAQGNALVLPIQTGTVVTITSCTYDGNELVQDTDYSIQYLDTSVTITLLAGSSIIPAQSEDDKTFIIYFTKYYYNDYTLALQGVYSYRTTVKYLHDEDECTDTSIPETP